MRAYIYLFLAVLAFAWSHSGISQPVTVAVSTSATSLCPASVQHEVALVRSLFVETNRSFDQKVYLSIKEHSPDKTLISYHTISFVFHYPTTNECYGSDAEMGEVDGLSCSQKGVTRYSVKDEIPLNYVRIHDTKRTTPGAEIEVLLGVAPADRPQDRKYFRRIFHFTLRDEWKSD